MQAIQDKLTKKLAEVERRLAAEKAERRHQAERFAEERRMSAQISEMVSQARDIQELTRVVTGYIKEWLDMEAVGIRMKSGSDYPYFVTKGFPQEFLQLENYLCSRNEKGELIRNAAGRVEMDCMCGNILSRRFDPALPFFTAHGSFWTNSTTRLLAKTTEADRQGRTRNQCHRAGYESVALIPLMTRNRILGLVQMNDSRPDRFTGERIQMLERVAAQLAHALAEHLTWKELEEARERLFQSQKLEAIGLLAGGIAHDFNNILSPIIGLTEMLLEDDLSKENKVFLKEVLKAGTRAKDLVKQIQTFGRKRIRPDASIPALQVAKEALKIFKTTLPSSIRIREHLSGDTGEIQADVIHFHQVFMNLVTNAFHAMEESGGSLAIGLNRQMLRAGSLPDWDIPTGEYVCLTIADTGTGIAPRDLPRIFEPYFTTKPKAQGTGLGLSMVHSLMSSLNGAVTVETTPGKGSVFRAYFPCGRHGDPQPDRAAPLSPDIKQGDEHILVVDDEPGVRKLLRAILSKAGYRIMEFGNSPRALEAFIESPSAFDLVITDLTMPEIMGDRLVAEMKQHRPDIPIILCTGIIKKKQYNKFKTLGVGRIITKPIDHLLLLSSIRELLD